MFSCYFYLSSSNTQSYYCRNFSSDLMYFTQSLSLTVCAWLFLLLCCKQLLTILFILVICCALTQFSINPRFCLRLFLFLSSFDTHCFFIIFLYACCYCVTQFFSDQSVFLCAMLLSGKLNPFYFCSIDKLCLFIVLILANFCQICQVQFSVRTVQLWFS